MVLLTSSAISVAISGGVICTFTFLLFLSGYVLQQQTVRSLQEALRNPVERVTIPTPVLPPQFQEERNEEYARRTWNGNQIVLSDSAAQSGVTKDELSLQKLWQSYITGLGEANQLGHDGHDAKPSSEADAQVQMLDRIVTKESIAYIFALPDTNSLCSAVLFAKKHKESTHLMVSPSIVFIYPATWDVSDKPSHVLAMDLLRQMQDDFSIVLHPVSISRVWAGITVEQQLLSELQRYRWPYHRAMYLGSPGVTVDTKALDSALALSDIKSEWTLLHNNPKSYEASHPSLLLFSAGRGLLYPRRDMKKLASRASTSPPDRRMKKNPARSEANRAAYVLFDEAELGRRREQRSMPRDLFDRFERDRREACSDAGLFDA